VVLGWALLLGMLGLVLAVWSSDALARGLLLGAAGGAALLAGVALLAGKEPRRRTVPDLSVATMFVALGLAALVLGSVFGTWLAALGLGLVLLGLAAVTRELLSARRQGS
jgi:hypothetical protein